MVITKVFTKYHKKPTISRKKFPKREKGSKRSKDPTSRERERVYFFASTRVTEKKNDYTYSSNSTITHNTMICAQWLEAPKTVRLSRQDAP